MIEKGKFMVIAILITGGFRWRWRCHINHAFLEIRTGCMSPQHTTVVMRCIITTKSLILGKIIGEFWKDNLHKDNNNYRMCNHKNKKI